MTDFSIEMAVERITDHRTRQYFEEVHRSYVGGNYRSAVVMLWSVVVCDLLFKLDQLATAYADATARTLLDEIERLRAPNPRSPEWESQLLDKVKERTHLLHEADYENLQHLQKHRHLCAHPVLTEAEALFSPNKETTRAQIRNALEGLLTKPAIMTKKVFNALAEDLEALKDRLPDDRSLKRYLESKYFPHLVVPVENAIFRSLWSLVFKVTDNRCEANRAINYRTLRILYERRPQDINRLIENDKAYFGQVTVSGTPLDYLLAFLRDHPAVFTLLSRKCPVK